MPRKSTLKKDSKITEFLNEVERHAEELVTDFYNGLSVRLDRDERGVWETLTIRASDLVTSSKIKKTKNGKQVGK